MRSVVLIKPPGYLLRLSSMEKAESVSESIIRSLSEGNMKVLDQLYDSYRDDFLRWAGQRFHVKNRDDLLDAWHDTMIMFYEQVRDKKLTQLTCEVKTYLFTIGYRRLIKWHKRNEKIDLVEDVNANNDIDESINVLEQEEINEQKEKLLMTAILELPNKTRQILIKRFMGKMSIPEIMAEMEYGSENAVSVTLSRGLKQLKKLIMERMASQKEWKR
ncbi:MAG TPA: sigma-70 family RNA polymerase sigma factor [Saprospiraceae bacterium]|nr:sigma-70 family RNA polymerase sigma factor [Saprospiraceae bacterium]